MSKSDKIMVWATCVIAAGTLVSAAAIALQWREMVKGGTDTSMLVGYAQRQADDADKIKLSAQNQAIAAHQFANTADDINSNINDAVGKLDAQSKATQDTARFVVSGNRPWIIPYFPPQHKRTIQESNVEWHNAGKSPAVGVFSTAEYFVGEFSKRLRSCREMEIALQKKPIGYWQYQEFVPQDGGRYETALAGTPDWKGPAPLNIHGCVWYRDVFSNTERTTEFFYVALQNKFMVPASEGVSLFYVSGRPFVYK